MRKTSVSKISTYTVVTAIVAAISLFSMAEEIYQFGLSPVLDDVVEFYRLCGQRIFGWLGIPFGVSIPPVLRDVWSFSVIGAGIYLRALWTFNNSKQPWILVVIRNGLLVLVAGVSMLGIICWYYLFAAASRTLLGLDDQQSLYRAYRRHGGESQNVLTREVEVSASRQLDWSFTYSLMMTLAVLFVVFSLNAYGVNVRSGH